MHKQVFDIAVLGAGASGLFAAGSLGGKNKIIIEGNQEPGLKVLASGGGLCNFGNKNVSGADYYGANPHFCLSALAGFKPDDFLALLRRRKVPFDARPDGRLFARKSGDILDTLLARIDRKTARFAYGNKIKKVSRENGIFEIMTDKNIFRARKVICALGGLSRPRLGAGGAAYDIAAGFGLNITPRYPALTGIIFDDAARAAFGPLAGVSCRARVKCGKNIFTDDILFTHRGLSGPAIFQLSLYGVKGRQISLDFLPDTDIAALLAAGKTGAQNTGALLRGLLPARLLRVLLGGNDAPPAGLSKNQAAAIARALNNFTFTAKDICGYDNAEITAGGVDTREISSQTMQARAVEGLYFCGEALDVSGRLGGYNLHWAWASAHAAAQSLQNA
ncbi:MAG: NAD(P)/FAD-dependent oxidoreductase [Elusimicrobiota bacterium]|jgi:predicted Rossmann fold flavoprotein|nr:NAD(P)/FAD-dependent oxidoreductase [Elusimicrobiota bacterium]